MMIFWELIKYFKKETQKKCKSYTRAAFSLSMLSGSYRPLWLLFATASNFSKVSVTMVTVTMIMLMTVTLMMLIHPTNLPKMRKVKFSRENREQTTQETLISVVLKITFKSIQDCISSENIV